MNKWFKYTFLLLALLLALGGLAWWALPPLVEALPGRYRQYIPEAVLVRVSAPLPTALPAPAISSASDEEGAGMLPLTIPTLTTPTAAATTRPTETATQTTATAVFTTTVTPAGSPTLTATPSPTSTPTPEPPPATAGIKGLEIIPQKFNNCGPTNLTITLNFYGHQVTQFDVAAVVRPTYEDRNVTPWELAGYVNDHTPLRAGVYSGGDLTLLKRLLAAGIPVVIEKGLEPDERQGWMGHYLTIFGYDDAKQEFYSMDTLLGPWDSSGRIDTYDTMAHYWSHFNHTFFVVYRPEQEPLVHDILGADFLDAAAMWQNAALKAQAAIESDPQNAFAWFNLGTSLTHLGRLTNEAALYQNAALAFDRARQIGLPPRMLWYQFQPYVAYLEVGRTDDVLTLAQATLSTQGGRNVEETYFYQGQALLALGDRDGALAAYNRAIQVNPNFSLAHQALSALDTSGY